MAATNADIENNRAGAIRSDKVRIALVSVPKTKPMETALVNRDACRSESTASAFRDGTTALAENHNDSASTSETASNTMAFRFLAGSKTASDIPSL